MRRLRGAALVAPSLAALLLSGCAASPRSPAQVNAALASAPPVPRCLDAARKASLDAALARDAGRYQAAIEKARGFLDALSVDPFDLRAHRIKGKKKLVEALDAYYRLHQIAAPEARPAILERVRSLTAVTADDRYHDMLVLPDQEFREDSTSYLRAAWLMDRMGLDVTRYRREIDSIKWRLDAHMKARGSHQRRVFHAYYEHFGLAEPFALGGALEHGLIARRADVDKLPKLELYGLTHEVFAAYDYGDRLDADELSDADRSYLHGALDRALRRALGMKDPDLAAELVACLRLLRFVDLPVYAEGLGYLLGAQNADGSFGSYDREEKRLYRYVKQGFYLHTTMVAIDALSLAFDEGFRKSEGPLCQGPR